MVADMQ
jgi:exosome complex RNA-binding protein Rrp42 (RNase PH superfamily)